jgi:ADP-heptose:LPS heptosyltransferase
MHILALVPGGISDQILFFPTLETLKRVYPNAAIDVVTEPQTVGAYGITPTVRKTIPFSFGDSNSLADWSNLLGVIREQEYELAITLKGGFAIGLLLWLSGIPRRIGFADQGTPFLTQSVPDKAAQYFGQRYHDLLQGVGITTPCPQDVTVSIPRKALEWAEGEQKRLGLMESGYLLVDATQGNYPTQSWRLVLKNIQEQQPTLPIVMVQQEIPLELPGLMQESGIAIKTVVPEDLTRLAALIAGANLVLCTEGDALQVAVAVKTFTIALLGATKIERYLPPSDRFVGVQSTSGKIEDISPQQVLDVLAGNR